MTRDKNSQKAEKKPLSTSEPVTQPQPVISAQSEYPQKARTASAQQPAQKIGSESSAQKSARGSKNTAPAGSQKTTAVRTVEDVAKPQNQGVFRAVTALYGALVMLYAGWQIFSGARAVPENDALAANASLESNYAFFRRNILRFGALIPRYRSEVQVGQYAGDILFGGFLRRRGTYYIVGYPRYPALVADRADGN